MDLNGKNYDSVSVRDFDSLHVKPVEECLSSDTLKESVEKKLEDELLYTKRKVFENFVLNMEKDTLNESTKRRRYADSEKEDSPSNSAGEEAYALSITNSSGGWTLQQVINFVKDECRLEISCTMDNTDEDFHVLVRFEPKKILHQKALDKLKEKEGEGKLSVAVVDYVKEESDSDAGSDKFPAVEEIKEEDCAGPSTSKEDESFDASNYFVRQGFLELLGVKPPITHWVIVSNFRCDKLELRDVLELAGRVLICSVNFTTKQANIMYSHPLEALQAISMLNGRQFYGKKLQITMNNLTEHKGILPKGLVNVGPGLGRFGKTLPDVGEQYKLLLKGRPSFLDACIFETNLLKKIGLTIDEKSARFARTVSTSNSQTSQSDSENNEAPSDQERSQKNDSKNFGPIGQKPNNAPVTKQQLNQPVTNNVATRPPFLNPIQPMQGPVIGPMQSLPGPRGPMMRPLVGQVSFPISNPRLMYPRNAHGHNTGTETNAGMMPGPRLQGMMPGPMPAPRGPMVGPNQLPTPHSRVGPRPGPSAVALAAAPTASNGPARPTFSLGPHVKIYKGPDPLLLQLSNLPPDTTFVSLGKNLAEFGRIVFLEMTAPGCANVRFANIVDVERCLLNRMDEIRPMPMCRQRQVEFKQPRTTSHWRYEESSKYYSTLPL